MSVRDAIWRIGATALYRSLCLSGATTAGRRRARPPILCYHNVVADEGTVVGEPGLHMPVGQFERQMRWLASRYAIVPARDLVGASRGWNDRRAAVTFDDAYLGVFEHAVPVLHRLGVPATIFAISRPGSSGFWWDQPRVVAVQSSSRRRRWLTDLRGDADAVLHDVGAAEVASMPQSYRPADAATMHAAARAGIDIGLHSATHRSLPMLTDAELEQEVVSSRAELERNTGVRVDLFAYPYAWCDDRVAAVVRRAGFAGAFGIGASAPALAVWCVRRINVPSGLSVPALEAWTAGFTRS